MPLRLFLFSVLFVLSSCAYTMEGQQQDITVETPGAENAVCYMYIEKLKYKIKPPETRTISKSKENLIIDCLAPGNRRKKEVIEAAMSKKAYNDFFGGIWPLAWDMSSASLFKYPDIITVDFTNTPVRPEPLPAQNRPDLKQPEEYPLEEHMPGQMRMNSERYESPAALRRHGEGEVIVVPEGEAAGPYMVETTTATSGDKGDLKHAVNPAGPPSAPATAPAKEKSGPAYPGQ